jgi:hypothetical protein
MRDVRTRLERLEQARSAVIRCVWLYVGWDGRGCPRDAGDGVHRIFVPEVPASLPPGLSVVLRHPGGAEVSTEAADWALTQLTLSPRQRALVAAARILVLVTAGGPRPPPGDDDVVPPEAEAGPPPVAAGPVPPAAEEPPPPAATHPPAAMPWPEWLPR